VVVVRVFEVVPTFEGAQAHAYSQLDIEAIFSS